MRIRDVISTNRHASGYVMVSTVMAFDHGGWETMVFPCDRDGQVSSWLELESRVYQDGEDAAEGHYSTVKTWDAASVWS